MVKYSSKNRLNYIRLIVITRYDVYMINVYSGENYVQKIIIILIIILKVLS